MTDKFSLVPRTMTEALEYAQVIAKSNFCPKEYRGNTGDVLVAVQYGAELGILPLQALQGIAVINGKPTIYGDLAKAVVLASPLCEDFGETDPAEALRLGKAICVAKRKGQATPITRSFSVDDAKKAGLWGKAGPWSQYPGRMLMMRARAWAMRDGFADILKGVQIREEVQDIPIKADFHVVTEAPPQPKQLVQAHESQVAEDSEPPFCEGNREPGEPPHPPEDGMPAELAAILSRIAAAKSLPELALVGADAASLEESLRADARKAYTAKQRQLKGGG